MEDGIGLSVDQVFSNDKDPKEAIAELRRSEASAAKEVENTSTEQVEEDITEDTSEEEVENTSETTEEKDDVTEAETEEVDTVATSEKPKVRKFKADGKEFEFTEKEMLDQFEGVFAKAINFTQKTQKIAPYRKMISALEEEGINADQLNMAIDALKGINGHI